MCVKRLPDMVVFFMLSNLIHLQNFSCYLFQSCSLTIFCCIKNSVVIDVGQGDATLIRMDHKTILIDTGGIMGIGTIEESRTEQLVSNKLIPFFRSLGILKIDYLIITHGDYDHIGGASFLVEEFPIGMVFLNANGQNEQERKLIQMLQKKKIPHRQVSNLRIQTINSNISLFSVNEEDENAASIITTLEYHDRVLLFLADATIETTKSYLALTNVSHVDVLKVAHHGSKNNTDEEIIKKIMPQYAIFSAGRNNLYNHPSPILVEQFETYQIPCFSTATDGTIHFWLKKRLFQTNPT